MESDQSAGGAAGHSNHPAAGLTIQRSDLYINRDTLDQNYNWNVIHLGDKS